MERLEKIRSVFAIVRDALLIILLMVLIAAGLAITGFVNSINPKSLSCENMVNSIMSGDLSAITGGAEPAAKYTASQEMLDLMGEIEKAATTGDKQTALAKIDQLRSICSSEGMADAVLKIDELKAAVEEENYLKALSTDSQLKKMFGQ